ncbi:Ankyrin repeat domain-containing protein 27 [Bienertia sinuspersici]
MQKEDIKIRRTSITKDDVMHNELFKEAYEKNWAVLLKRLKEAGSNDVEFVSRRPYGSNIVHVAVVCCASDSMAEYDNSSLNDEGKYKYEYSSVLEEFIVESLKKFPILNCHTDIKGRTPLHLAMNRNILKPGGTAFQTVVDFLTHIKQQASSFPLPPWEGKDNNADTLLHLAIKYKRYKFAKHLIALDPKLVSETNNYKETPLHVLCRWGNYSETHEQEESEMVDIFIDKDPLMVYWYDGGGFTPFLRASQEGALKIATSLLNHFPHLMEQRHLQSNTVAFHLINLDPRNDADRKFIELPNMDITPYKKCNKDGKTVLDVLAKAQDVPRSFQDFLSSKWLDLPFGIKDAGNSIYGVRFSNMKEYMGPLGVVAALLTTITFTAAFTIPGGYDENIGTPILAKKDELRMKYPSSLI